eukprot:3607828-Pleurochrysis_carterae.AAC.1
MTFKAAWISVYRLVSAFWPSVWPLCCRSEAGGELEAAMQKYEDILKQDPNNLYAMKRQVSTGCWALTLSLTATCRGGYSLKPHSRALTTSFISTARSSSTPAGISVRVGSPNS